MKTKSEAKIKLMKELRQIRRDKKKMAAREKTVMEALKLGMQDYILEGGGLAVILCQEKKKVFDKALLEKDFGKEFIEAYSKMVGYERMVIKEAA